MLRRLLQGHPLLQCFPETLPACRLAYAFKFGPREFRKSLATTFVATAITHAAIAAPSMAYRAFGLTVRTDPISFTLLLELCDWLRHATVLACLQCLKGLL